MRALVILALLVGAARADDAADREEARREFAAGQTADRQRDWQTAIEHYLRANDLVPHPNAMFNIATDYERLGKLREAAVWYQRYIDAAQDSPDRDRVIRALRDLQLRPGTITVQSKNPTADVRVLVDGSFVGVTPYSGFIKGGAHRVTLEYNGRREEREVKIEFGEPTMLDVPMRDAAIRKTGPPVRGGRAAGTLHVEGQPPGARILVDNRPAGVVPADVPLEEGLHTVRVVERGFAPYDTTVEVRANETATIEPNLQRSLGSVDQATTVRVGYLLGAGGGIDAEGNGNLILGELGVRATQYDASVRLGKLAGLSTVDLMVRYALTKSRVAPFLGIGYTFVGSKDSSASADASAGGYLLSAGLRFDLSRGEHTGISLVAESGIRYYADLNLDSSDTTGTKAGLIVPVMTSLQITYK